MSTESTLNIPKWNTKFIKLLLRFGISYMVRTLYSKARNALSAKLVEAREKANLTQKQVQEKSGISQSDLSKIENGQRKVDILILEKLAALYNKPITFFQSTTKSEVPQPNYWMFKLVTEEQELPNKYVYYNTTPNHKQVKTGDLVVIVDKENILGFAKISRIASNSARKKRKKCPVCGATYFNKRASKQPLYRCNKGHEFDKFTTEIVSVTEYHAYYGTSFRSSKKGANIEKLRSHFLKNYNGNLSIQRLNKSFFSREVPKLYSELLKQLEYPQPEDAFSLKDGIIPPYTSEKATGAATVIRQIKVRRGDVELRNKLRKRYKDTCVVTGCTILSLLEATRIVPGIGKLNHASNGLLLRADIHTLFDLDLIGIEPTTLTIRINAEAKRDGYNMLDGTKLVGCTPKNRPSKEALEIRWNRFLNNQ